MSQQQQQDIGSASAGSETDTQQAQTASAPLDHLSANVLSSQLSQLNFPCKLHQMLSAPKYNDIICWLPHGRSWRVQQQQRFEKEVLPIFFRHGRYSSFARQINGWGFRRIASGPDFNSYYHNLFIRDAPDLCLQMTRPSTAELAERKKAEPVSPPNFYLMPTVDITHADLQPLQIPPAVCISESSRAQDDYVANLIRRISLYPPQQQDAMLQLELHMLDKRRQEVLEQLQRFSSSDGSNVSNFHVVSRTASIPPSRDSPPQYQIPQAPTHQAPPSAAASVLFRPQMEATLAQRAALELYLQMRQLRESTS